MTAVSFKRVRDIVILTLGSLGFLQQVFLAKEPNYIIMAGTLSLLLGIPLLRFEDRKGES
jgi:hypothetical protein